MLQCLPHDSYMDPFSTSPHRFWSRIWLHQAWQPSRRLLKPPKYVEEKSWSPGWFSNPKRVFHSFPRSVESQLFWSFFFGGYGLLLDPSWMNSTWWTCLLGVTGSRLVGSFASNGKLVGGLEHEFYFPFHIWDVILPIDELIFFKMVIAPPTSIRWSKM